jgi:transcription elongation factor GreA
MPQKPIYVTEQYLNETRAKLQSIENELIAARMEKNSAFEGDTNSWHDNFEYEHAVRIENMLNSQLDAMRAELAQFVIAVNANLSAPTIAELWSVVEIKEINLDTDEEKTKQISILPFGLEDFERGFFNYKAPIVQNIFGREIGEEIQVKLPSGRFVWEIISISRFVG